MLFDERCISLHNVIGWELSFVQPKEPWVGDIEPTQCQWDRFAPKTDAREFGLELAAFASIPSHRGCEAIFNWCVADVRG